ncbi:MAG: Ger(x)C family spore germination protein [Anaerobacillus sp.]|uniref:Ger(x)C family spore germination protein n=1 Tax=Anaerobacillus sp. TaxID=1872506 RepID=UPI003919A9F0
MKLASVFLIVVTCLINLTSCIKDAREIDHRSMIVGMGIDTVKDSGDEQLYEVTLQIPILLSGGQEGIPSGSVSEFETFSAKGAMLLDTVAEIEAMTPTVLFFGHLKVVTISEELAREGLDKVIDFIDRLPQVANQIYLMIINDGTAEEFITQESPLVSLPALYLNRFFQADQKISRTKDVKLFEYRRDANMISKASTIPLGKIVDNKIVIEGMGVFVDHKMIGELVNIEVAISELLKGNKVSDMNYTTVININNREEKVAVSRGDLKAKINFDKTTPLTVKISIKGNAEIAEVENIGTKVSNDVVNKVNLKMENEIERLVKETIKKMKALNAEPWLIGHRLWATDPDFFAMLNWEENGWRDSVVEIDVDFEVVNTGQKGFLGKRKIGR